MTFTKLAFINIFNSYCFTRGNTVFHLYFKKELQEIIKQYPIGFGMLNKIISAPGMTQKGPVIIKLLPINKKKLLATLMGT